MQWFYNFSTMKKLLFGFGLVCSIMVGVGWLGISKMAEINASLEEVYKMHLLGLSAAKQANMSTVYIGRITRHAMLSPDPGPAQKALGEVDGYMEDIMKNLRLNQGTLVLEEGKRLNAELQANVPPWVAKIKEILTLHAEGKPIMALERLKESTAMVLVLDKQFSQLSTLKEKLGEKAFEESTAHYAQARSLMMGFIIGAIILSFLMGISIARSIAGPLSKAVGVLESVADGDFTVSLDLNTRDEVGQMAQALNLAVDKIRDAMREVTEVSGDVSIAAQQLSSASEEISSGAQEQASSLEETAASLEEISSTVKQNAENAHTAAQLAGASRDVAEKGGRTVSHAVEAMGEINRSSKRIADIITAIDEIAFQTNLLALNAAVEAARAGEQGRGFAVVAAEVRNLAQRSATAAKEIKGLIQDSVRKVETGSELVNESGQFLQEIVASVKRVNDIIAEIAAASREQSTGIEQVTKATSQMDQVTQANASQTEEMAGTAESLASQAEQLQRLVSRFKVGDTGASHRPARTTARTSTTRKLKSGGSRSARPEMASFASPAAQAAGSGPAADFDEF